MGGALNGRVPNARPHWPIGWDRPTIFRQEVAVVYLPFLVSSSVYLGLIQTDSPVRFGCDGSYSSYTLLRRREKGVN